MLTSPRVKVQVGSTGVTWPERDTWTSWRSPASPPEPCQYTSVPSSESPNAGLLCGLTHMPSTRGTAGPESSMASASKGAAMIWPSRVPKTRWPVDVTKGRTPAMSTLRSPVERRTASMRAGVPQTVKTATSSPSTTSKCPWFPSPPSSMRSVTGSGSPPEARMRLIVRPTGE